MNKKFLGITAAALLLFPLFLSAQTAQQKAAKEAADFVAILNTVFIYPLIGLLTAVAFFMFLWGAAEYFIYATNEQNRQKGVKHMTWGIIGLLIMVTAWGILEIAAGTLGLGTELDCADDPTDPSCATVFTIP